MAKARTDPELREMEFISPAVMTMVAASTEAPSWQQRAHAAPRHDQIALYEPDRKRRRQDKEVKRKGGGKGNGKHKGSGKGGGTKLDTSNLHRSMPDGRQICYAYNREDSRCRGQCGRVHACQKCFEAHPAHSCKKEVVGKPDGK